MVSNKSLKYVYYYVRYSLMLYPFVLLFSLLTLLVEMPWGEDTTIIAVIVMVIPIFISFFILPGLIYEDGYNHAWHGFGKNQINYNMFLGLTLGIGPVYIFFKKYDPILKEYFEKEKAKTS